MAQRAAHQPVMAAARMDRVLPRKTDLLMGEEVVRRAGMATAQMDHVQPRKIDPLMAEGAARRPGMEPSGTNCGHGVTDLTSIYRRGR